MIIILVKEFPPCLVVKGSVKSCSFGNSFGQELNYCLHFAVRHNVASLAITCFFDKTKDYVLFVPAFVATEMDFQKINKNFLIQAPELFHFDVIDLIARDPFTGLYKQIVDLAFSHTSTNPVPAVLSHLSMSQLRFIPLTEVIEAYPHELLQRARYIDHKRLIANRLSRQTCPTPILTHVPLKTRPWRGHLHCIFAHRAIRSNPENLISQQPLKA